MSGEKITARLRTERDLSNGKERIQVYEVGRYLVIIREDRKSTGQRLHVEIHYGDNHDERVEKEGSYLQEGVDTAKYIGETFIKPMVEGKWNWEVTV